MVECNMSCNIEDELWFRENSAVSLRWFVSGGVLVVRVVAAGLCLVDFQ